MIVEIPDVFADRLAAFTAGELELLRQALTSPAYLKLLSIAECAKPSANCQGAGSGARDAFSDARANARLGEMRGWEMHRNALLAALSPKVERTPTTEEFQPVDQQPADQPEQNK